MCTNTNKNLNFNNPNMFGRENFDLDISYCDWSDIGIDLNIDIVFKLISEWKTFGQKIFLGCRIDMQNVRCRIGIADIIFNVGAILRSSGSTKSSWYSSKNLPEGLRPAYSQNPNLLE